MTHIPRAGDRQEQHGPVRHTRFPDPVILARAGAIPFSHQPPPPNRFADADAFAQAVARHDSAVSYLYDRAYDGPVWTADGRCLGVICLGGPQ